MGNGITIIGGGVSGITTALTLQLLGYNTIVYAEHLVDDRAPSDPRFASLYPAASVIPHSVNTERMKALFCPSQQIFDLLYEQKTPSIQMHRHFEVHEFPVEDPPYADYLDRYEKLEKDKGTPIPHYDPEIPLHGWSFNCLVAEWPRYIRQLYQWYRGAGGSIVQRKLNPEDIQKLDTDLIVNCSGIWSLELFDEPGLSTIERGHLLFVKGAPPVTHKDGLMASYNYTPETTVYCDPEGNPADVYFYPRSDGWILGGSRQAGTIDDKNRFEGSEYPDSITLNGVSIPRPIFHLNKKILECTYNRHLGQYIQFEARIGYRFIRDLDKQGLRTEYEELFDKKIIHNYGHGGAGVTLSWGCALEVGNMVRRAGSNVNPDSSGAYHETLNKLQELLLGLW